MRTIRLLILALLALVGDLLVGQTVNTTYTTGTSIGALTMMASDNDATNAITLSGNLLVNGNVIFGAMANSKLKIDIAAATIIRPSAPGISTGAGYGHLILFADTGAKVTINVNYDLTFTGTNADNGSSTPLSVLAGDMNLTFSGAGQIEFVIADNKTVSLTSLYESSPGTFASTVDTGGSGVRGVILMDHPDINVWSKGVNKVVVSRKITSWSSLSSEMQNDITFLIGHNSFLTFGSINRTGFDPASTEGISANETASMLSAALAFDVSCAGPGRTVLKLVGTATANKYRDGALTIGGNLIDDGSGGLGALTNANHIRQNLQLNKPAGGYAFLRVTDEKAFAYSAYATQLDDSLTDYLEGGNGIALDADGDPSSRGLWIINSTNSYPSSAANPYGDSCWFNKQIFTSGLGRSPIRPGLVLAINGQLSVYHNTFVHHIATVNTRALDTTAQQMTSLATALSGASQSIATATIKHNASAFIIDGYATYSGGSFQAYKYDTIPKITLWGAAKLIVSSGVSSTGSSSVVTTPSYTIGTGTYDGSVLSLSGGVETTGVGEHVLDIQGLSSIRSFLDSQPTDTLTPFARHRGTLMGRYLPEVNEEGDTVLTAQAGGLGEVVIGCVQLDYTGTPITSAGVQVTSWPLAKSTAYKRYNRGCININNDVSLRYSRFGHYDVSRNVVRDHVAASPSIIGGEYALFANRVLNSTVDIPTIWLENGQFRCHESLCISGVRLAVKEQTNFTAPYVQENSSSIFLFNHGDALDANLRGYGRVLQLGSQVNTLAGGATHDLLNSAYMNVFRQTPGVLKTELVLDTNVDSGVLNPDEQSFQLVHLANLSNLSIGWTSTQGIISRPAGPSSTVVYPWQGVSVPVVGTGWTLFSLDEASTTRATLKINGSLLYVSAGADGGATPPSVVTSARLGGVVYVNHGGEIIAGAPDHSDGSTPPYTPKAAFDVPIALRVPQSTLSTYNPIGALTVPFDQLNFLRGVQPYNLDTDFALAQGQHIDISFQKRAKGLSSDLTIPWGTIKKNTALSFKDIPILPELSQAFGTLSRSVGVQTSSVAMPTSGLLRLGSGVAIEQLGISGATAANPLLLYLTGDGTKYATVREMVSVASSSGFVPGEGAFAAIFMDKDACLGVGSRNWNAKSVNAWNLIGKNRVTIVPNGDCFIELNEDIVLCDAQPIVPTVNFGASGPQRVTFYSESVREIRVPAGGEFDLSAFGGLTVGTNQQITFDGNVRLIFEPGSTLRFPGVGHTNNRKGPVLYMNGRSQLIFEGLNDRDTTRLVARNLCSADHTSVGRSRIIGCGKIWLNKNASMKIMDTACVGVEADTRTLETDILISIAKESALLVGDPNTAGGILQVGNVVDLSDSGFTNVYFTLRINGPRAVVHMDREAFVGFGAGVINRNQLVSGSLRNSLNNMTVKALFNVAGVSIRAARGSFSHNQIYDGTDSQASILAIGPSSSYTLDLGVSSESIWRGGGNMVYVAEDATISSPLQISVLSSAQGLTDEYPRNISGVATTSTPISAARTSNNGKVSIMGSGIIARQVGNANLPYRGYGCNIEPISQYYLDSGLSDSDNGSAPSLLGGKHFVGPQPDLFRYLSFAPFARQTPSKYCVLGSTQFEFRIGHIIGTTITRTNVIPMLGAARPDGAAKVGALLAATLDSDGNPALYALPEVPNNPPMLFTAS